MTEPSPDDGIPDAFVSQLVNGLCKDIFVWRMARAMLHGTDVQRRSAITRMRNAEHRITEIAFSEVEREQVRLSMRGLPGENICKR